MNFIKRLIPNNIKQEGKYLLYDLLKQPYNRFGVPLDVVRWLPADHSINFIDIGASRGTFASAINKFYNVCCGILIEPIPYVMSDLQKKFQGDMKFLLLNLAVSDKIGESEFYLSDELDVLSSLLKIKDEFHDPFLITHSGKKIKVKTNTLDNITAQSGIDVIDLIKIDVQGAEHLVLKSGCDTLKRTKLLHTEFSYRPMYEGSSTFFDLYEILYENNFRFVGSSPVCHVNGELIQSDGLFVNNVLCP